MSKNTNLSFLTDYITADITNGRIGINNASPTVAFDVVGVSKFTGASTFSRNDAANFSVIIANAFINQGNLINFQQNKAGSTINAYIGHGGDSSGNFIINNGNQALTITNAGYVGVNTTAPNTSYGATIQNPTLYSSNALRLERGGVSTQGLNIIAGGENVTFNAFNTESGGLNSSFVWTSTAFSTTTERMRITSAGNVGIGTSAAGMKLDVVGGSALTGTAFGVIRATQDQTTYRGVVLGYDTSGQIGIIYPESAGLASSLAFWTYSGSAWGERMRITSGGDLGIGTTTFTYATSGRTNLAINGSVSSLLEFKIADSASSYLYSSASSFEVNAVGARTLALITNATIRTSISSSGVVTITNLGSGAVTATSGVLSTTSDMTLKVEDGYIDNALEKISQLKPRYFYWKEESGLPTNIRQLGFYAQEVNQALGEEAANTPKNENDKWGIYDRGIIAMLTKGIQELKAEIETLKNK
jgi:hypothetical protein